MKTERFWRLDQKWFLAFGFCWFLAMELTLRLKLGVIFWLCFGWLMVLDWEAKVFFQSGFSRNPFERILKSLYYAFIVTLLIFLGFTFFNFLLRSFNNNISFFQLP